MMALARRSPAKQAFGSDSSVCRFGFHGLLVRDVSTKISGCRFVGSTCGAYLSVSPRSFSWCRSSRCRCGSQNRIGTSALPHARFSSGLMAGDGSSWWPWSSASRQLLRSCSSAESCSERPYIASGHRSPVCGVALFFGLTHFQPLLLPPLVAAGIVFGVCAWRTGRLGLAVVAHAAFNASTVIALWMT